MSLHPAVLEVSSSTHGPVSFVEGTKPSAEAASELINGMLAINKAVAASSVAWGSRSPVVPTRLIVEDVFKFTVCFMHYKLRYTLRSM